MKTPPLPTPRHLLLALLLGGVPLHALDLTVAPGGNIQNAIDQVNAAGGGTVNLQAGTHTLATSLLMRSNVTLKGAGSASTTIQNSSASDTFALIQESGDALTNITIRDLALDGRNSAGGNGIYFDDPANNHVNFQFLNLEVKNVTNMGVHPKGMNYLTETNCYVHDSGSVSLCHNQYFRRTNNVTVSDCRFEDSPAGDGSKFTIWNGISVTNCFFSGNRNRGLRTQDTNINGYFAYNTVIDNAWDGAEIVGDSIEIARNAAYYNGWDTASSYRFGLRTPGGSGTVHDNTAYGNGSSYPFDIHGTFTVSNNVETLPAFPIIQAESLSASYGIVVENCSDTGGGQEVGYINNNDYAAYANVDLTGVTGIAARVATNNAGGTIEVHLDGVSGRLLGTVAVTKTGGWQIWTTTTGTLAGVSGVHTVYLVFKGGSSYLFNLNWVQFQ